MEVPSHGIVVLKIQGKAKPFNVFQFKDPNWWDYSGRATIIPVLLLIFFR
jgi:hypothetical protein